MADVEVPRALPRWLVVVLGFAGTVVALAGLHLAASVVAPVLLALVLTVVVHPILTGLQRRGVRRGIAVTVGVLVADGGLIALVLAVGYALGRLAAVLPTYAEDWNAGLAHVREALTSVGIGPDQIHAALQSLDLGAVLHWLTGLFSGVLGVVGNLVFVLATILFMCADAATLPARLTAPDGLTSPLMPAMGSFASRTRTWFVVSTVFGLIVAVLDGIALVFLGIPLPFLWALLSFITNYIPNIGFVIGLLPPAVLALIVDGPRSAIIVVVLYCVINFVLQTLIQPVFVSDAVGLSLSVTFLSLVVWGPVLGPIGAVLSIPLTLLVRAVLLETDPSTAWARALVSYGSGGTGGPHEQTPAGPDDDGPTHRPQRVATSPSATG